MPASLPSELWLRVLEDLEQPLVDDLKGELRERHEALKSCCLVSRLFHKLAQPLFWRRRRLTSPIRKWDLRTGEPLPDSDLRRLEELRRHTRVLQIVNEGGFGDRYSTAAPTLRAYANVEELELRAISGVGSDDEVTPETLACLSNLRSLNLVCSSTCYGEAVLPALEELTFNWCWLNARDLAEFASPSWTPALRALAISDAKTYTEEEEKIEHAPQVSDELLAQLDFLQLDGNNYDTMDDQTFASDCPVLLDLLPWMLESLPGDFEDDAEEGFSLPRHFRIRTIGDRSTANLLFFLQTPSLRPATLVLPWTIHPDSDYDAEVNGGYYEDREEVVATCAERGIEILWCEPEYKGVKNELLCREFWEYVKGKREGKDGLEPRA
ncbi:hypothetical protein JCM10213_005097 [Rhodosporidiobolus nylandii]